MDFDILLKKFLKEELSPEELTTFLAAVKEPANEGTLREMIGEKLDNRTYQGLSDPAKLPEMFRAMLEKAGRPHSAQTREIPTPGIRRIFIGRRIAAAAILLLAGVSCYFIWGNKHQQPPTAKQESRESRFRNDIAPGGNKAILTLADGQKITLDSAADGQLARQRNASIIKLTNGQLAYQTSPTPPSPSGESRAGEFNTLSTPRGGQYQLTLPDGSRVWLNAASSIRYPTAFSGKERKVEITGEAYFEVAKNAAMPFKVNVLSGGPEIEVLGTSFNIMAYDDDTTVSATLLEGAVKITKGASTRMIAPGQQLIAGKEGSMHVTTDVDVQKTIAWKNGKFIFYNDDIRVIMRQLTRWYDIDVRFAGVVNDHYTGRISRQVNISQVLKMMEAAGGVSFSVQGKEVKIN